MSNIVTDNLLSQYIADSGKLNDKELEAVHNYLLRNPEDMDIVTSISAALDEVDMDEDLSNLNHPIAVVPYTDEELHQMSQQSQKHALELLDDILVERTEEELIAHFGSQAVHCDNSQAKKAPQVATLH